MTARIRSVGVGSEPTQAPADESVSRTTPYYLSVTEVADISERVRAAHRDIPPGFVPVSIAATWEIVAFGQRLRLTLPWDSEPVTETFRPSGDHLPWNVWATDGFASDGARVAWGARRVGEGTYVLVEFEPRPSPMRHSHYRKPLAEDILDFARKDVEQVAQWYFRPSPPRVEAPCWKFGAEWPTEPEERWAPLSTEAIRTAKRALVDHINATYPVSIRHDRRHARLVFDPLDGELVGDNDTPSCRGRFSERGEQTFISLRCIVDEAPPDELEQDLRLIRVNERGVVRWDGQPKHLIPA